MRFLVFADLHFVDYSKWRAFLGIDRSRFDAILLLGDIDIMFLKSIRENFSSKVMLGVLGNHDFLGDLTYYGIPDIHGRRIVFGETSIIGIEGCVRYKKEDAPMHEQEDIVRILNKLSPCDIVISHNSPYGIHDKPDNAHVGYHGLLTFMDEKKPKYLLHGHQHKNCRTTYSETEVYGLYGGWLFDSQTGELECVLDLETE